MCIGADEVGDRSQGDEERVETAADSQAYGDDYEAMTREQTEVTAASNDGAKVEDGEREVAAADEDEAETGEDAGATGGAMVDSGSQAHADGGIN